MTKKLTLNSEKLMSITAVLVSVLTLGVFVYQTNLIRKEQHMAVFPYLELSHSGIETDAYQFVLSNKGIGPALITEVRLIYKNQELNKSLVQFVSQKRDSSNYPFNYNSLYNNRLISAGEEIELIGTSNHDLQASKFFETLLLDKDLDLEIRYQSIYSDKWKVSKLNRGPKKLE